MLVIYLGFNKKHFSTYCALRKNRNECRSHELKKKLAGSLKAQIIFSAKDSEKSISNKAYPTEFVFDPKILEEALKFIEEYSGDKQDFKLRIEISSDIKISNKD